MIPKQLALGKKILKEEFFNPITNNEMKPIGGLWTSTYTPYEEYLSNWHEFHSTVLKVNATDAVLIDIDNDAKIFTINTVDDFFHLIDKYSRYISEAEQIMIDSIGDILGKQPNYVEVAKDYDALFIKGSAISQSKNYPFFCMYNNVKYDKELFSSLQYFNMFDVETLLIFNFDIIKSQEYIGLKEEA